MNNISYFFGWLLHGNHSPIDDDVAKVYSCISPEEGHLAMWTFLILISAALIGTSYFYFVHCKDINKAKIEQYWAIELIGAVVMLVAYVVACVLVTRNHKVANLINEENILATGSCWIVFIVALLYYVILYWVISWLIVGLFPTNGKNVLPFMKK